MDPHGKNKARRTASPSARSPAASFSTSRPRFPPSPQQQQQQQGQPTAASSSTSRPRPPPFPQQQQQGQPTAPPPPRPPPYFRNAQRVAKADLYFKTSTNSEWVKVDPLSIQNRGDLLVDIAFNGGIEVCQLANEQSVDYGKMWKIRWEPGQYNQVHVDEFQRPSLDKLRHIAVQFHPLTKPMGSLVVHGPTQKRIEAFAGEGSYSAAAVPSYLLGPAPEPARFPLGRLSDHFADDGYTSCLLIFPRNEASQKGLRGWIWASALTFLNGANIWHAPPLKWQTVALQNQTLPDFASSQYLSNCPFTLRATNRGYWLASRNDTYNKRLPVSDLPSEALVVADRASVNVLARKRQLENLVHEQQRMEKMKTDMEAWLDLAPILLAKHQQKIDELKRELKESGAIGAESDQQEEEQGEQEEQEDDVAAQKQLMKEKRELAMKRKREEEEREMAAKKERIRLRMEKLGIAPLEEKEPEQQELKGKGKEKEKEDEDDDDDDDDDDNGMAFWE